METTRTNNTEENGNGKVSYKMTTKELNNLKKLLLQIKRSVKGNKKFYSLINTYLLSKDNSISFSDFVKTKVDNYNNEIQKLLNCLREKAKIENADEFVKFCVKNLNFLTEKYPWETTIKRIEERIQYKGTEGIDADLLLLLDTDKNFHAINVIYKYDIEENDKNLVDLIIDSYSKITNSVDIIEFIEDIIKNTEEVKIEKKQVQPSRKPLGDLDSFQRAIKITYSIMSNTEIEFEGDKEEVIKNVVNRAINTIRNFGEYSREEVYKELRGRLIYKFL